MAVVFGASKLPEIARNLGRSSGEFKKGLKEGNEGGARERHAACIGRGTRPRCPPAGTRARGRRAPARDDPLGAAGSSAAAGRISLAIFPRIPFTNRGAPSAERSVAASTASLIADRRRDVGAMTELVHRDAKDRSVEGSHASHGPTLRVLLQEQVDLR